MKLQGKDFYISPVFSKRHEDFLMTTETIPAVPPLSKSLIRNYPE